MNNKLGKIIVTHIRQRPDFLTYKGHLYINKEKIINLTGISTQDTKPTAYKEKQNKTKHPSRWLLNIRKYIQPPL